MSNKQSICDDYSFPDSENSEQEKFTLKEFNEWVLMYSESEFVQEYKAKLEKMQNEMFGWKQIDEGQPKFTHIDYSAELPEKMTKEAYIFMYRQIWATIRHDLYKDIEEAKN